MFSPLFEVKKREGEKGSKRKEKVKIR